MKKTAEAARKSRTHFEQVPIDVVKRVAEADVPREAGAATDEVIRKPAPGSRVRAPAPQKATLIPRYGSASTEEADIGRATSVS